MTKEKKLKLKDIFKEEYNGKIFSNKKHIGDYEDKTLKIKEYDNDITFIYEEPDLKNCKLEDIYNYEKEHHNSIKFFKRTNLKETYNFEFNCHVGDVLIKQKGKEAVLSLNDYLANNWEAYFNTGFTNE